MRLPLGHVHDRREVSRVRRAVRVDDLPGVWEDLPAPSVVRRGGLVIVNRVHAALQVIVAATFSALFIYITGRRALERDITGTVFAACIGLGLSWATVRAWRRWRRL